MAFAGSRQQQQKKDSHPAKSFGRQLLQALFSLSPSFLPGVYNFDKILIDL